MRKVSGVTFMKVKNSDYDTYKTARQWALQGKLPIEGIPGIELWANQYCKESYVYYSPEEVNIATDEQIKEFFKPERERRNQKARLARKKQREIRELNKQAAEREILNAAINDAVEPYLKQIAELHRIIRAMATGKAPIGGEECFVIDTETTGLDAEKDELLQVSIIDGAGKTLFDSYFKPCTKSWKDAERVNGISPEMVKNAPRISDRIADINGIICRAGTIIGYNTNFDLDFLANNGLILSQDVEIVDVMQEFAPIYGEWSDYYNSYKWQKLTTAAAYYGYDWNCRAEGAHNSLADCYATLYVFKNLQKQVEADSDKI